MVVRTGKELTKHQQMVLAVLERMGLATANQMVDAVARHDGAHRAWFHETFGAEAWLLRGTLAQTLANMIEKGAVIHINETGRYYPATLPADRIAAICADMRGARMIYLDLATARCATVLDELPGIPLADPDAGGRLDRVRKVLMEASVAALSAAKCAAVLAHFAERADAPAE